MFIIICSSTVVQAQQSWQLLDSKYRFSDGLAIARLSDRADGATGSYEYIDRSGNTAIPGPFEQAEPFNEGFAVVGIDGWHWLINTDGERMFLGGFEKMGPVSQMRAWFKDEDRTGFISPDGRIVIPAQYQRAGSFNEGLAPVQRGGVWGYIDLNGREVIPPQFYLAGDFRNGIAIVRSLKRGTEVPEGGDILTSTVYPTDTIKHCIDRQGNLIDLPSIPGGVFVDIAEGRIRVSVVDGAETSTIFFDIYGTRLFMSRAGNASMFSEGVSILSNARDVSVMEWDGNIRDRIDCLVARPFSEGRAATAIQNEAGGSLVWGFVDTSGVNVIPHDYQMVTDFHEGRAYVVTRDGIEQYIDTSGDVIWSE